MGSVKLRLVGCRLLNGLPSYQVLDARQGGADLGPRICFCPLNECQNLLRQDLQLIDVVGFSTPAAEPLFDGSERIAKRHQRPSRGFGIDLLQFQTGVVERWPKIGLAALFIVTVLGLGLLISTVARTQLQAMQFSFLVMLPSVLLSGFMFPRAEMPVPLYAISFLLPVTYFIEILRGVILRAADSVDLLPSISGLVLCCTVILAISLTRFRKQLD